MAVKPECLPGRPFSLGATFQKQHTLFALYSQSAQSASLELYEHINDRKPARIIPLDPRKNRTDDVWHVTVNNIAAGQLYAYGIQNATGSFSCVVDPYAKEFAWPDGKDNVGNNIPKCVVVDEQFDWGGDKLSQTQWEDTVIYETHVRGLTIHPSSNVKAPGTFTGLAEKAPYLKELGITAVELLPVMDFPDYQFNRYYADKWVRNYWGYNTLGFFAPKRGYAHTSDPAREIKTMVKTLHRHGIEVILDVVFNHTCEGDADGPAMCYKVLDRNVYYQLDGKDRHLNYSGCGNTINTNHPAVQELIVSSLRYWAENMHVDGFRFDLAALFYRDEAGAVLDKPPILEIITKDPVLKTRKLIAEPWDADGLYKLGGFPGNWREWNDRYRDDVRRFWNTSFGRVSGLATRLFGSADIFQKPGKSPLNSINFITAHDGFTLNDLVSYQQKHNEENGENNRDGSNHDCGRNFGVEGRATDQNILETRERQMRNFIVTLFLSQGVPMLLGGDEFKRTQNGNNNAYCQDNPLSWYDWALFEENASFFRFVKNMIAFRAHHRIFRSKKYFSSLKPVPSIDWFNAELREPDWVQEGLPSIALWIQCPSYRGIKKKDYFLIFNRGDEFKQKLPEKKWIRAIDTSLPSRKAVRGKGENVFVQSKNYFVQPNSVVVLHG